MAGVASDKAYTAGKDLLEDVFFERKQKLEDKVGGFNKHFDKQIMKHKTRYAEEINVQNKIKIDDVKGLDAAYSNVNGITRISNTSYFRASGSVRRHCPLPFLLLPLSLVFLVCSIVLSPSLRSPSSPSPQATLSPISLSRMYVCMYVYMYICMYVMYVCM